jgi:hypothetical protein
VQQAFDEAQTTVSSRVLSSARIAVIIFVVLAGGRRLWAFFSYSTFPVIESTSIADSAEIAGEAGAAQEGKSHDAKDRTRQKRRIAVMTMPSNG